MNTADLDSLMEIIGSGDTAESTHALEQILEVFNQIVRAVVASVEDNETPLFIMERLHLFGSIAIPHLEELYGKLTDGETKILTAISLLLLNNPMGVQYLLEKLANQGDYDFLITYKLVNADVREVIPVIEGRLRSCTTDDSERIICFLEALLKLSVAIPPQIKQSLGNAVVHQLSSIDREDTHQVIQNLEILKLLDWELPKQSL